MSNQSNQVFVLDTNRKELTPCTSAVADRLLKSKRAAVFRQRPFTIILNKEVKDAPKLTELKTDPGSRFTGLAILDGNKVLWGAELTHRGQVIKDSLESRRSLRRGRRGRKTRYRQPRFLNRARPKGWLAPSLQHRVDTTLTWVNRLRKLCPIGSISQELVRFDMQQMDDADIEGTEYQQGLLKGFTVREYLLEKWGRKCAYCSKENVPLQVEHVHPKSKGGSDSIRNLALACERCNTKKGTQSIERFLKGKPNVLKKVKSTLKAPLKDAAAVNATRWALCRALQSTGLPVSTGSGALTKFNRVQQGLPKAHWIDAACVGETPKLEFLTNRPLLIKSTGHGCRQVIHVDKYGFPRKNKKGKLVRKSAEEKTVKGFQTGDLVKAIVHKTTKTKQAGTHIGKVSVRSCGSFNISTPAGIQQGINWKDCSLIQRKDGYNYAF